LELFLGVLTDLRAEEHDEDIALANCLVVLVLQASLRHRVEEVIPHNEFEEAAQRNPILVLATDKDLKLLPILFQFRGRSQKQLFRNHRYGSLYRISGRDWLHFGHESLCRSALSTDIRQIPGGFEARIALLTGSGKGIALAASKR